MMKNNDFQICGFYSSIRLTVFTTFNNAILLAYSIPIFWRKNDDFQICGFV